MNKILVSATNENLEHYALNMFKSFRCIDKTTHLLCIIDGVHKEIEDELINLGVECVQFQRRDRPNLRSISISMTDYVSEEYDTLLWMDIDALFLQNIDEVWNNDAEIVALTGMDGYRWYSKRPDGSKYICLGMWKTSRALCKELYDDFMSSDYKDEGVFIRNRTNNYDVFQLDGPTYYCGREMVNRLWNQDGELYYDVPYSYWNTELYSPKCLQFNIGFFLERPRSEAVDLWIKQNL